jgi:hypothetical protein
MRSESQCCKKYLKLQSDTVISPKVAFLIGSFYELFECECNSLFFSFSEEYDIEELKAVFDNFTLGDITTMQTGENPLKLALVNNNSSC